MSALSEAMGRMRIECREMAATGPTFSRAEIERLAELFLKAEAEAIRLESIETAARARDLSERAVAALGLPVVDLDAFEAAILDKKIVPFPLGGRAREGAVL